MWEANGKSGGDFLPDAKERVLAFLPDARHRLAWKGFVAELDGHPVGTGGAQLFAGLTPHVLTEASRKYGYLWGVYVEHGQRRRGIGRALVQAGISHLKTHGCSRALLHATPYGRELFAHMGFKTSSEMFLDL